MLSRTCTTWVIFVALVFSCDGGMNLVTRFKHRKLRDPPLSLNITPPIESWFTQILDHFQPTDTRTWKQRYGVVKNFYKDGGPVFLSIGGEGAESPSSMLNYVWVEYAKKYNALMFDVEHRFYGESHPTSDLSVENLKYLSSEQALADLAYFIAAMNREHNLPPDTKWVAFGGSYPGNLAAWVRYKYPHLIHAAVASSAPVLAQVDFPEYLDVVRDSLATHSTQCVEAVEDANKEINTLLKTPAGRKTIEEEFKLCYPIDITRRNDVVKLLEKLIGYVQGIVQHDDNQKKDIFSFCDTMVNPSLGTPLKRYAIAYGPEICLHYKYDDYIKKMRNTTWSRNKGLAERQWTYQSCTEFGFFQSSERKDALFGEDIPVDFYIQQCSDIFGKSFTKDLVYRAVDRSNIIYGGLDLKATRVVYIHGSIDPWHALGITKTRITESPVIYINGTAHCANMHPPQKGDPPALEAAIEEISTLIGKWLQES